MASGFKAIGLIICKEKRDSHNLYFNGYISVTIFTGTMVFYEYPFSLVFIGTIYRPLLRSMCNKRYF